MKVTQMHKTDKLYRCSHCNNIITEKERNAEIEMGSMGMCFCQYTPDHRVLNNYIVIDNDNEEEILRIELANIIFEIYNNLRYDEDFTFGNAADMILEVIKNDRRY